MGDKANGEITIAADKAAIIDVVVDLDRYPEWADGVKEAEVTERYPDGRTKTGRFTFASGPIKDTFVLEYEYDGDNQVSWKLSEGHVITQEEGNYTLTDDGDGNVHVVYNLEVGINLPVPGLIKRQAAKHIVHTALTGLKKRVESLK